ncbi:MAG: phosphate acyltransferase, partial [Pseudomonadota bacterium]
GKTLGEAKLVTSGAGAAAIACLDLLVDMGMPVENITVTDIHGVVYEGRPEDMEPRKGRYAKATDARSLEDVISGADIFLGLSAPGVLKPAFVKKMAEKPIIMALANPTPEILPEEARQANPQAIIATGRSDYPNQVNNVLCFPFIFRGALDVGATVINEQMKIACVKALADLAMREGSDIVASAYGDAPSGFGPDYLIPKPFDPRLIVALAPAVAQAAMESGVATRPIEDMAAYRQKLEQFVYRSGLVMRPVFDQARQEPMRIAYAEGEEERVLRAVQIALDDRLCHPILIARRDVLERRIERLGLRFRMDQDVEVVDPQDDPRFNDYVASYHELMGRRGASPERSKTVVRTSATTIGALMVHKGEADGLISGTVGPYIKNLDDVLDIIPPKAGVTTPAAMSALILPEGPLFLADTFVTNEPTVDQLVDIAEMAAETVQRFGVVPKVALVSYSNFGTRPSSSSAKMMAALAAIRQRCPDLEIDGEMHADAAISQVIRDRALPESTLVGRANLLIMPNLDAANIAFNLVKSLSRVVSIGPILMGASHPVHVVNPAITVRGLVNMTALATVDAQMAKLGEG